MQGQNQTSQQQQQSQSNNQQSVANSQSQQGEQKPSTAKGLLNLLFVRKWHPQPTVDTTILIFAIVGILFIIIGIVIAIFNSKIIEIEVSEYNKPNKCVQDPNNTQYCTITIQPKEADLDSPIFLFYTLDNFYQNHRRYMKSKSTSQLSGSDINQSSADDDCEPVSKNKNLGLANCGTEQNVKYLNHEGQCVLEPEATANPCGLIAKSYFNDEFELFSDQSLTVRIPIDEDNISWPEDKGKKFKQPSTNEKRALQWINPENEHFIVWMRTSGLPNFRKLWGKIDTKLYKDQTYYMRVKNQYDVDKFKGSKGIVLSTSGPLGGKNYFLSAGFIVVGVLCIIIAFVFFFKKRMTGGNFGEFKVPN